MNCYLETRTKDTLNPDKCCSLLYNYLSFYCCYFEPITASNSLARFKCQLFCEEAQYSGCTLNVSTANKTALPKLSGITFNWKNHLEPSSFKIRWLYKLLLILPLAVSDKIFLNVKFTCGLYRRTRIINLSITI